MNSLHCAKGVFLGFCADSKTRNKTVERVIQAMFEADDAELRIFRGYNGDSKVGSFCDWLNKIFMENKKLETPYQALTEELEYLKKTIMPKKETKKSKEATEADRQVFASIENHLGFRQEAVQPSQQPFDDSSAR